MLHSVKQAFAPSPCCCKALAGNTEPDGLLPSLSTDMVRFTYLHACTHARSSSSAVLHYVKRAVAPRDTRSEACCRPCPLTWPGSRPRTCTPAHHDGLVPPA